MECVQAQNTGKLEGKSAGAPRLGLQYLNDRVTQHKH